MTYNPLRWGDRIRVPVVIGDVVRSPSLFRVLAPVPTVWRVICFAEVNNAANFGVSFVFEVMVGIGSAAKEYRFPIPINVPNTFEIPGQNMTGSIRSSAALAVDAWILDGSIAPLTPWQGLEVRVTR